MRILLKTTSDKKSTPNSQKSSSNVERCYLSLRSGFHVSTSIVIFHSFFTKFSPCSTKKNTCKTTTQIWKYSLCIYGNSVFGQMAHIRMSSESAGNIRKLPKLLRNLRKCLTFESLAVKTGLLTQNKLSGIFQ